MKTIVFQVNDARALTTLSTFLGAMGMASYAAKPFPDGENLYIVRISDESKDAVVAMLRALKLTEIAYTEQQINAVRIDAVADALTLLGKALTGEYKSEDEPGWTLSDVLQKIAGVLSQACSEVPREVLVPVLNAAAEALRRAARK